MLLNRHEKKINLLFFFSFLLHSTYPQDINKVKNNLYKFENTSISYSDINYIKQRDSSLEINYFFSIPDLLYSGFTCEATLETLKGNFKTDSGFVLYKMSNISIQPYGNNTMFHNLHELEQELGFPFSAHYDGYGKLISWYHSKSITEMTVRFISNFLNNMLFIKQKDNLPNWDTQEQNTTGNYTAHYSLKMNKPGYKNFTKTKSDFIYTARSEIDQKYNISSFTNFTFNDHGILDSSGLSETIITLNNNDTINASAVKMSVKLIHNKTSYTLSIDKLTDLEKNGIAKQSLVNFKSKDEINRSIYKVTLGSDNLDSLITILYNPFTKEERKNILAKFRALFYLYPESCNEALTKAKFLAGKEEKISILIQALINCRTPYCTDALVDYLRENKNDKNLVFKTVPIMSLTETPTKNLLGFVTELLTDSSYSTTYLSNTFKLAYCNIFKNLKKTDKLISQKMFPKLTAFVEEATDTLFKIRLMGNTADSFYYDSLINYSLDSSFSEMVRVAAIEELIQFDSTYSARIEKYLSSFLYDKNENIIKTAEKIIQERRTKKYKF